MDKAILSKIVNMVKASDLKLDDKIGMVHNLCIAHNYKVDKNVIKGMFSEKLRFVRPRGEQVSTMITSSHKYTIEPHVGQYKGWKISCYDLKGSYIWGDVVNSYDIACKTCFDDAKKDQDQHCTKCDNPKKGKYFEQGCPMCQPELY